MSRLLKILFGKPDDLGKCSTARLDAAFRHNLEAARELKDAIKTVAQPNNVRPIRVARQQSGQRQQH
jgi:hypothetical protein